jgi:outer membrane receptor for ferrienterochelin and colicins
MKKFLLIILVISIPLLAQNITLKGKIISDKAQPVFGASVMLVGTSIGSSADENGLFEIKNITPGTYSVQVTAVGFEKRILSDIKIESGITPVTIVLRETAIEQDQIVISASKYEQNIRDLTVSTTVLLPDMMDRKNYQTFDDMLRQVPGVQMNLEQVSIRGSSGYSKGAGARVLVALNGLPVYSGDNGDIIWEMIPTSDIERIEIIKGPASSLYGSTAIGGVINIITKQSVKNPITHFRTYYGLFDKPAHELWNWSDQYRQFYGVELTHSDSYKNLGYTFSLKKFDNDSYRKNDFYKRNLAYVKLNYNFSEENYLTFFANYLVMNRGNFLYWGDSRTYALIDTLSKGNTVESNRFFGGLLYHHHLNENLTADIKSSYYRTKFSGHGLEITTSTANLVRGEALTNYKMSDAIQLTTGVEASYAEISSNIFKSPTFLGAGFYAQTELKLIQNLIATFGFRFDYIKLDTISGKNAFTPRAGLNYKLSKDFVLRGSIGTGFRAPTPSEVFTSTAIGGGVSVKENPNLTSESSLAFELGANYLPSSDLNFDLAFYQTEYNNFIEPNLLTNGDIQFINLTKARIQGVELITNWSIIPNELKISAGYNYMWTRDIEMKKAMKYRPRNIVYAQLRYSPNPFDFGIDFRYWSRVEEIDDIITQLLVPDGQLRVPVYITDITAGYTFLVGNSPTKIYLNAKNIFNYNYVEFIGNIAPIRSLSLSMEVYF